MSWFSRSKPEEYRLLDKKMPHGDLAFWVRDRKYAGDGNFVDRMINESTSRLPTGFLAGLATTKELGLRVFDYIEGGCEVHIRVSTGVGNDVTTGLLDDGATAAKAACDLAMTDAPPLDPRAIELQFRGVPESADLRMAIAPRPLIEPALAKILQATSSMLVKAAEGVACLGWEVGTLRKKGAIGAWTKMKGADGGEIDVPALIWRGDDGQLYAGMNGEIGDALLGKPR